MIIVSLPASLSQDHRKKFSLLQLHRFDRISTQLAKIVNKNISKSVIEDKGIN